MKDEIKEILQNINDKFDKYYIQDIVSNEDIKKLLDYITNLQEENERLKYLLDDNNSIKAFVIEHNKVDKAIELLKEAGCYDEETKTFCDDVWEELPKLLNILNGGDDNE